MPNDIKQLPDGNIEVKLETGETFKGSPLEVTEKLAQAKVETRRHYEQQLNDYKAQYPATPPTNGTPPSADPQEAQLQEYLVNQWAKGLGFKDGNEAKVKLGSVLKTTEEVNNQVVASNFLSACPDFPNTPEAIEKLSGFIDKSGWDFTPQSMIAAHSMCLRNNDYKALSAEEQNAQWTANLRASNATPPPPPPGSSAVDNRGAAKNEWEIPLDELRKQVLAGAQK